ncbi:hypothetical protein Tco_1548774 [Tanacetum coccineum]
MLSMHSYLHFISFDHLAVQTSSTGSVKFPDDNDDEHRKCLRIVTFESTIDSEIMETKSFVSKLHKVSSPDGDYLIIYRVNGHFRAFNYLMEELLQRMLDLGLEVEEESTVALHLLASPGSNSSGQIKSVDSLLKTIRLSIHLVIYNEELAIPEQTATEGKLKENQGCRVDTDQVHQNGDLKNRSVWIHPPGLQDVHTQET